MSIKAIVPAVGCLLIGLVLSQVSPTSKAHAQETESPSAKTAKKDDSAKSQPAAKAGQAEKNSATKATEKAKGVTDLELLQATADEFEKAFNLGDAKTLAALFNEQAEVVDEDGNVVEGRANIETRFAEIFKDNPKAHIEITVTNLRQLGPDVAIEDGVSTVTLDPEEPASRSPYAIVHLKRDGKWSFARVRDFPEEVAESAADHVKQLEWLVGHWVDESRGGRVETTCKWSEDGNYLLQDYVVKTRQGIQLKGTQRIGWDPLKRTIRAWVFDNSGGIVESTWTAVYGGWMVKVEGCTADGEALSATRVFTPLTAESYQIDSTNQILGGELLPDTSIKVVRQPPKPSE